MEEKRLKMKNMTKQRSAMNKVLYMALFALMAASLCGCEMETSDNGDLDGFWQVASIETLATGEVEDLTAKGLTWGFQGRLLQLREATLESSYANFLCRFEHTGSTLTVSSPVYNNRDKGDPAVEDVAVLLPFGIANLTETFTVEQLTASRMRLRSATLRVNFRKY